MCGSDPPGSMSIGASAPSGTFLNRGLEISTLLNPTNREAVTPQKRRIIEIPWGFDGFQGSSTLARRSAK